MPGERLSGAGKKRQQLTIVLRQPFDGGHEAWIDLEPELDVTEGQTLVLELDALDPDVGHEGSRGNGEAAELERAAERAAARQRALDRNDGPGRGRRGQESRGGEDARESRLWRSPSEPPTLSPRRARGE